MRRAVNVKKTMKIKKTIKYSLIILFVLLLLVAGEKIYLNLTDGFSLNNITSEFAYRAEEAPEISPEELIKINAILSQKFTYLGKGAQTYAFTSEDGAYVLKLVKQKHLKIPTWTKILLQLPGLGSYREHKVKKYKNRILSYMKCCHLTYDKLKEESGLIYMHLHRTKNLHPLVTISDKINLHYELALDDYEFLIQKKAELLFPALSKLFQQGDHQVIFDKLQNLIHLLILRSKSGIIDKDSPRRFSENIGFADNQPLFIDFGEFSKSELIRHPAFYKAHIRRHTEDLKKWLENKDLKLVKKFSDLIEEIK